MKEGMKEGMKEESNYVNAVNPVIKRVRYHLRQFKRPVTRNNNFQRVISRVVEIPGVEELNAFDLLYLTSRSRQVERDIRF